jgi:acetyl/propionyl-CoA carboxylase alpha subunit
MNTRLQVEHPVTELITGLDLVKEQISVAAGNKLSFSQSDLKINGHALECRIYAEDPSNNFLPSTGAIIQYVPPSGPGIRVDSGFDKGSEITVHYDPLISKLICWADNRQNAIDRMHRALSEYVIGGLVTNISFLKTVIRDPSFRKGEIDINFLNDGFMSNLINMEEQKNIKEIEKVSAIFAAIIKTKSSIGSLRIGQKKSSNNWQEQMYE